MRRNAIVFIHAIVSLLSFTKIVNCHVALTYPPARKFDLDFLDNSRTRGPCGMPKGSVRTSLLAGSAFNVTWHLAYPHRGGFKLQVLDNLERPVLDLTPVTANSDFVTDDVTAQSYAVQLPQDFSCEDCTVRLLRQASEWSSSYRFWSCADVDVKKRKEFREDCSGHGRYLLSKCRCDRLYYGSRCQYRDECIDDADCGDHGRCIDVEATTAPRKQCYCELGWFGPACTKKSAIRSTEIDFDWYSKRELSNDFHLHWRILKEDQEIEIVMVVNGTGYAGIGWRPFNITPECKNFPEITDKTLKAKLIKGSSTNDEISSDQKPEFEPSPEPGTTTEPEPNPETEPEATTASGRSKLHQRRQKSVSSRATKPGESLTTKESVETSVSYRITATRGKRETDKNHEGTAEPEPEPKGLESSLDQSRVKSEPEPEPASEPDAKSEPESRSEPEPKSEPKYEPKSEPKSEPTSEPESLANEKHDGKPGNPKSKKNNVTDKNGNSYVLNPYTPRHDFHSMDCTDIIIGMAKGTYSRVLDYYTRDRSTPRLDTFWGGRNDITTAMGFEKDGKTTILFRKKLLAQELSDHSIVDGIMHVIWAKGQESGRYKHFPKSGLEKDRASVAEFYKPDELKYHGHGDQRGQTTINFFDERKGSLTEKEQNNQNRFCGGSWKSPKSCDQQKHDCEYFAKWEYFSQRDEIKFDIETTHTNTWTGIAFSNDQKMSQTDAIIGWVDKNGRSFLMDTWINGYNTPLLDEQNIYNATGRIVDGVTSISFIRKRTTLDSKDIQFSDKDCFYFQYPVHGGAFNAVNKKIKRHQQTPYVSGERICITSCSFEENLESVPAASSKMAYNLQIKVTNLSKIVTSSPGSSKLKTLSAQIITNLNNVLKHMPGFDKITVGSISKSDENTAIAKLNVVFDRLLYEKGRALKEGKQIKSVIMETIEVGKLGALSVDPNYFIFEAEPLTAASVPIFNGSDTQWFSSTKLYIVIGCLIALIMIAVIQASCTIYKTTVGKSSSIHKERLIPSSAWKDYSAVNTNYAFEPYEAEEKTPGSKASILPITKSQGQLSGNKIQSHAGNGLADTKSLQRLHGNGRFGNNPPERNTYSLPRTSHPPNTHHQGYYTHRPHSELQPDFYFMPSQRKYSGEVVRVYVDYNNVSKK